MTFLHPALLVLLPLAAIPILLHLLTLHRLKTVELSTFRFLFDSYVQQRRRMQFLEALLAMLRTAFLLLLVLMICRPMVRHWNELFAGGSGRDVVMLFDCSASMNTPTAGVAALERAKTAAVAVVDRLSSDDRITLVRVVARPEEVFSKFASDREAIKARIDELKAGPSRANWYAALTQVFGPEAPPRGKPVIYLFTDCQSSGWREVRSQKLERLVPEGTPFVVVQVGSTQELPNLSAIGAAPPRQHAVVGLPVYLQPRVANFSKNEAEVNVSVLVDDKEVARAKMNIKPGESASQRVIYTPSEIGTRKGRFEISSNVADAFPDDDKFAFTLQAVPRPKVLLVNGNPSADPLDNEGNYLRTAFEASRDADNKSAAPRRAGTPAPPTPPGANPGGDFARSLDLVEVPEANLNPQALRDVSVVILANCGALNAQHFVWLRDFVAAGGGLIVLPGERVNPTVYNDQFFAVPGTLGDRLTAITLGAPEGDLDKADTFERLAVIDFSHPLLSVFADTAGGGKKDHFRTVRFYRRFPLTVLAKRESTVALAEFATGKPALVESRFGDGLVLLAAFPANIKWSNLPLKPDFLPLVVRMVGHVQHRPEAEGPSVVRADGAAEFSVTAAWAPASGKVMDPSHRTTTLEFERAGSRLLSTYERTSERGYYQVEFVAGRPELSAGRNLGFAVNLAPEESDLAGLDDKQLAELLPGAKLSFVDASAEAQQRHAIGEEIEIWRPLIYVMFIIIAGEFLLATMSGAKKEEDQRTVAERIRDISTGSFVARMTGAGKSRDE